MNVGQIQQWRKEQDRLQREQEKAITPTNDKEPTPRPMVLAFAIQMERELQANAGKGEWSNWQPSDQAILSEMDHHISKLRRALAERYANPNGTASKQVSEFAADIANFAMKAWDLYGS